MTNPTIILKALLNGYSILHNNEEYVMDSNYELCVKRYSTNKIPVYLKVDMGISLQNFIKLAEQFTENEITIINSNVALNAIKSQESRMRTARTKRLSKEREQNKKSETEFKLAP